MDSSEFTLYHTIALLCSVLGGLILYATISRVRSHRLYFARLQQQSYQLVTLQEEDRMRMAQEMHDGVGRLLSAIRQQIHLGIEHGDHTRLAEAKENIGRVIAEIGNSIQLLAPYKLREMGLLAVLEELFHSLQQAYPIEFQFEYQLSVPPPTETAIHLYRLVQEAVHNAVKHSGGSRIQAGLMEDKTYLYILCSDNGRGFSEKGRTGLGLKSLELRCHNLGGLMERRSIPGAGTTYLFTIPLKKVYGTH